MLHHSYTRNSTSAHKQSYLRTRPLPATVLLQKRQVLSRCLTAACLARGWSSFTNQLCRAKVDRAVRTVDDQRPRRHAQVQIQRLSPVRVIQGTVAYDVDDYEWSEEEATGSAAATNSSQYNCQQAGSKQGNSTSGEDSSDALHDEVESESEGVAGNGVVGVFVAGWMFLIALMLKLLRPVAFLLRPVSRQLRRLRPGLARRKLKKLTNDLPEGWFAKLNFVWEQPLVKSIRITLSVANWSVRLPVLLTVVLTQGSLLASQVSLPVLAPLLLGTGMMMNSIKANASFIIPRLGLLVVLLWVLWFVNSVVQTTWVVLKNQGRIDGRTMSGARMITECTSLLLAGIVVLSMLGINVNALLLPTGVVLAIASKDLLHNLIAGFYLVLVQPFRLGDKVAVTCNLPNSGGAAVDSSDSRYRDVLGHFGSSGSASSAVMSHAQGWFEGVCEKVDLRYTVLRDGRRRLMVPNTAFVSREFLVYDDGVTDGNGKGYGSNSSSSHLQTSSTQQQSAQRSGASSSGDRPGSPEPFIREGHMTTELPPLAPPIFPGMWPHQHAPYVQQFHHGREYTPAAYYTPTTQVPDKPLSAADTGSQQQEPQQSRQQSDSSQQQQQQQSVFSAESAGRGPPGYLPQGFMTPGLHYVGIPVYYGLPGMGAWGAGDAGQQQQQPAPQSTTDPTGMLEPIPGHPHEKMPPQPPAWKQQQHQQQQPAGKQHGRHVANEDNNHQNSSAQLPDKQRQQHASMQPRYEGDIHIIGTTTGSEDPSVAGPQAQMPGYQQNMKQQAAHAAALVSVSGYQAMSHQDLLSAHHLPAQHGDAKLHDSSRPPHHYQHYPHSRVVSHPHQAGGADLSEPFMPPSAAASEAEAGAVVSLPGLATLPVTGVASAAAAAAAMLGSASSAIAEGSEAVDAVSAASTAADIVGAGGQATQVVQPLLDIWHSLNLDQLH